VTTETDPVTFARDQTANRLADRFEGTGVEVTTRDDCPESIFIAQASKSNLLIIEDELDDLGRGVTVRRQVVANPHDSGPTIELRLEVDTSLVGLRQATVHLDNELTVTESEISDHGAEVIIEASVAHETFFNAISTITSARNVRVDYIRGLDQDRSFTVHFRPTAD